MNETSWTHSVLESLEHIEFDFINSYASKWMLFSKKLKNLIFEIANMITKLKFAKKVTWWAHVFFRWSETISDVVHNDVNKHRWKIRFFEMSRNSMNFLKFSEVSSEVVEMVSMKLCSICRQFQVVWWCRQWSKKIFSSDHGSQMLILVTSLIQVKMKIWWISKISQKVEFFDWIYLHRQKLH